MRKTDINLVPDVTNPTPDYYCTWQTQLYATSGGTPSEQRKVICEKSLFDTEKPYGWAYFYEKVRQDLFIVMDDSWDVPLNNDTDYYGSLILSEDKFPSFTKDTDSALKLLSEKIKSLGWKGLGGWICAQESPIYAEGKSIEEYWIERLKAMDEAGILYWKVDWGGKASSFEFRKMLTDLARIHAPNLVIEHAMIKDIIPFCDSFRTYDVPAIMSIPMTIQKITDLSNISKVIGKNKGIINCEDEAYIAAAGGCAMGIMRHPYFGSFPDGREDMSFPKVHRDIKTKMFEVIRAVRWHRIAPAFSGGQFNISDTILSDNWKFENTQAEIERWWLNDPVILDSKKGDIITKSAPSCIARNTDLPHISPDINGNLPFCVAALNPNGVYSIATLGRTIGRNYFIPECDVTIKTKSADTIGIFGKYKTLTLETDIDCKSVLMQDIAEDVAYDITEHIRKETGKLKLSGELISNICANSQPHNDTSEPGVILKLNTMNCQTKCNSF